MIKKHTLISLVATCATLPGIAAADTTKTDPQIQALQNQTFQLQAAQSNNEKQLDSADKALKKMKSQFPALNKQLQAELQKAQDNNNKTIKQLQSHFDSQIKTITDKINELEKRVAAAPAKTSS